jgi:hypothetical protein
LKERSRRAILVARRARRWDRRSRAGIEDAGSSVMGLSGAASAAKTETILHILLYGNDLFLIIA